MPRSLNVCQQRKVHVDQSQTIPGGNAGVRQQHDILRLQIGVNDLLLVQLAHSCNQNLGKNQSLLTLQGAFLSRGRQQQFPERAAAVKKLETLKQALLTFKPK